MKEIKAYVHNHRIGDVIRALKDSAQCDSGAGCRNLAVIPVQSPLKAVDARERHYSVELAEEVIYESRLELICEDQEVDELVGIIARTARTGQADPGWIFVIDVVRAIPVGAM
nr:P-II family nitrogen regulator [Thiomonas sp.]